MSRPSHAMQQQAIDDALDAAPARSWRWFWTPDPKWLNTVNTTSMRTVNAVRMFVGVTVLWALLEIAVVWKALTRCDGRPDAALRACEESLANGRLLDFAATLFDSYGLLLAAMAGIAVAEVLGKRATDTEHVERKERAKKAPIIAPVVTSEHPAQPQQQMTVNVGGEETQATERPAYSAAVTEEPEHPERTRERGGREPNLYADDERGE